ncbi:MAG: adenylyltransferase/cytidyltransferase family protein [Anaerolineae bacterium]|nr:adenylyltransferase/cytidyltransferase family protein [Caldilineales bacterium]MCX7853245.1 adenylyltransferase/cytidyltransferase family protein [Caldilineales bacterium]MDW8268463.1 adenylyltransferase/cytidyltransferase family protein [Anaerolineae bacterium]
MTAAMNAPILSLEDAVVLVGEWRRQGQTVVFTNGHFDLLHLGHIRYLQAARSHGDRLVVGLNSDASTRLRKGPQRPIVPQEERAALLAALRCVDAIVPFDGEDCRDLVAALRPDVYVKGSDWNRPGGPRPPEAAVVAAYGGRVAYIDLEPGKSTTALINTVLTRYREVEPQRS